MSSTIARFADEQISCSQQQEDFTVSQAVNASRNSPIEALRGQLIVSVQANEGDPLDDLDTLTRIATSVLRGGAGGLRAEGVTRIAAFRKLTRLPIIGILKTWDT